MLVQSSSKPLPFRRGNKIGGTADVGRSIHQAGGGDSRHADAAEQYAQAVSQPRHRRQSGPAGAFEAPYHRPAFGRAENRPDAADADKDIVVGAVQRPGVGYSAGGL